MNNKNNEILDVFRFRYACKKFDPTKTISKEDFNTILEAARLSPSSFGFEPWNIIVVQDEELKKKLYPISWGAQNSINGASHLVILLARKHSDLIASSDYLTHIMRDIQKLPDEIIEKKRQAFSKFQQVDFNLLQNERTIFDWACKQTYIAMTNMMTAAAYLGLDSCPIEGFNIEAVDKLLSEEGLLDAEHFGVSVMVGFGYRNEEQHEKTRQNLDDIVTWR